MRKQKIGIFPEIFEGQNIWDITKIVNIDQEKQRSLRT